MRDVVDMNELRWRSHEREHVLGDKALALAAGDVNRRLEAMNELREQITSERGLYLTRETYDDKHNSLEQRIGVLERASASLTGRDRGVSVIWLALLGAITVVVLIVDLIRSFMK